MALEYDDEEEVMDEEQGSLIGALTAVNSTTPLAQTYAKGILDARTKGQDTEETAYLNDLKAKAEANRAILRKAREKLAQEKYPTSLAWLRASAALGAPTKTGQFGESISNLSSALVPFVEGKHAFKQKQNKELLGFDAAELGADEGVAKAQLELLKNRMTSRGRLDVEALKTLGRTIPKAGNPSLRGLSTYGKIAENEGHPVDTPAWNARVKQLREEDLAVRRTQAGMDEVPTTLADQRDLAKQYGLPVLATDPYANMSTKNKTSAKALDQREAEKALTALDDQASIARNAIQQTDRFLELNRTTPTSKLRGLLPAFGKNQQEMDSITADMARKIRQPGEGSTSNYDAQQFLEATFGRGKVPSANAAMAKAFKARQQNVVDLQDYLHNYFLAHQTLRGAMGYWNQYLESNSIFDPEKPGQYALNPRRVDYKTFFRSAGEPVQEKAEGGKVSSLARKLATLKRRHQRMLDLGEIGEARDIAEEMDELSAGASKTLPGNSLYEDLQKLGKAQEGRQVADDPILHAEGGVVHMAEGGALRQVAQGATLGLADELEGLVDPAATQRARGSILEEQEESPMMSQALQTSGTALLIKGIQIAKSMGMTNAAIRLIPKSEILRMALAGGAAGGFSGMASGEGDQRGAEGMMGLALGTGAGPLAGLATKYGLTALGDAVARSPFQKDPTSRADLKMIDALERDRGVDVGGRMSEARRLGVPTTMGTSGGENLQALGKAAIREGADEADLLATEGAQRMAGSRGRVEERINRSLKPDEYFGQADKLTSALYTNAKPLYEKAYIAHPKIESKGLRQILETDAGEKAIKEAMTFFNNIPGKKIGEADALKMVRNPSLEFYDKVKQGFDQLINQEETRGPTPLGKTIRALRTSLVRQLDEQAPEYREARAQYKGDLEVRDALKDGRERFHRLAPEEIRRAIADMSFAERDAFRSGVAQRLFEDINKPVGDVNAAHRLITSPATSAKLEAIFEKPGEFKIFKSALERELEEFAKSKDLASAAGGARLARASHDPSLIGKLGTTLEQIPNRSWLGNAMSFLHLRPDMSEETAEDVAKILRTADPKQAADYLSRLSKKAAGVAKRKSRAGKAGLAVAALTGAATAPAPTYGNLEEEE